MVASSWPGSMIRGASLRILVNVVKGPKCYEDVCTVGGVTYKECRDACYARGLLDDDTEWHDAIDEPSHWATGRRLRRLFVTILVYCEVGSPLNLWNHAWKSLSEDILYMKQKEFRFPGLVLQDSELQQYTLIEIEKLLKEHDKSLTDYPSLPLPDNAILTDIANSVLRQELNYDTEKEAKLHAELFAGMNGDQNKIYSSVLTSVENGDGQLFFVCGAGGTGKTYLYNTIIAKLRSVGKVVVPVASSGIAALLLPGGSTAHSRFKLPLNLTEQTMCEIHSGTRLASLMEMSDLIIWDEAPMAHRHCFETLDRTLRDLLSVQNPAAAEKPFGGKTVLLGGDFRQILPVIPQGTRQDTVLASISKSYLWAYAKVYTLSINMRLRAADKEFANWILNVGNGTAVTVPPAEGIDEEGHQIVVDKQFMINNYDDPLDAISEAAYPNFLESYSNREYLTERAILTPTNETAHKLNKHVLSKIPSEVEEYLSSDTVAIESTPVGDWTKHYTQEYLNSLEFPGLPNHKLGLKVGAPVMMLRNLNQKYGLCNGTRMVVKRLGHRVIDAVILTGTNVGAEVLIPRIQLSPNDTTNPFTFRRRQFPVRLCYAMTINKSQGQSLKQVALYLPKSVFSHGQLYVALSRVTTPGGLKILDASSDKSPTESVTNIVYREIFAALATSVSNANQNTTPHIDGINNQIQKILQVAMTMWLEDRYNRETVVIPNDQLNSYPVNANASSES
ncbi:ATP-dependent DNA helicase pif1-like [Brassica napus]|uniref:ATP-dependent DNA helicase pif1-like n=1 Tax=Brassica napus TaxID=3708 RepID=UPI00207932D3|nr:ATP-dependent DNA helicase pif1-like [Brassica napus]